MQLLLTDTKFVQISGTRVAVSKEGLNNSQTDAIELPSTIFQRFCGSSEILAIMNAQSVTSCSYAVSGNEAVFDKIIRYQEDRQVSEYFVGMKRG